MKRKMIIAAVALCMFLCVGCEKSEPAYTEVKTELSTFDNKFYYSLLSEEEKLIYREVYQGIMNLDEEIIVHSLDPDQANGVIDSIMYDFPEIFWIDGSAESTSYSESLFEVGYTVVDPTYIYTKEDVVSRQQTISLEVERILGGISAEATEYDKIKYVYDYLVDYLEYVDGAPDNQNICSAFIGHETVCAGYAKANQYLLNEIGIECSYVMGESTDDEGTDSHAWNIVKCNDNYYYVDVTWADPVVEEGSEILTSERIYDYLLCDETEIADSHTLEEGYDYPACASNDLNYYRLNQMYYEAADEDEMLSAMKDSIKAKEASVTLKFANTDVYAEGSKLLLDELMNEAVQYLCNYYNLWEVEYYYEENIQCNRFTVYWQYK